MTSSWRESWSPGRSNGKRARRAGRASPSNPAKVRLSALPVPASLAFVSRLALCLSGAAGDAILFYHQDANGNMDETALHGDGHTKHKHAHAKHTKDKHKTKNTRLTNTHTQNTNTNTHTRRRRANVGACPVLRGEKWGANLWVWNGPVYQVRYSGDGL